MKYLEIDLVFLRFLVNASKDIIRIDFVLYPVKLCVCVLSTMLGFYLFGDSVSSKTCPSIN